MPAVEEKKEMIFEPLRINDDNDSNNKESLYSNNNNNNNNSYYETTKSDESSAPVQQQQQLMKTPRVNLIESYETVIIFDWDDTLLASSHLGVMGYNLSGNSAKIPDIEAQLRILERSINTVLSIAKQLGHVHIVTNAEYGWVQMSCQKFLPNCWNIVKDIEVVSARSSFEHLYPNEPVQWKTCAMLNELSKYFTNLESNIVKNVLAFGDSQVERNAIQQTSKSFNNILTKNVKFVERPSIEQVCRELDFVAQCMASYIYSHEKDLDLMLTISMI